MRLLVLATFPLVAGVAVAGPALLELAYGSAYSDAGPVLLVMLAPLLVQPMLRVSEGVLYGLGRPRFIVIAGLVATVVDIGLAFLLIPSYGRRRRGDRQRRRDPGRGRSVPVAGVSLHRPVLAADRAAGARGRCCRWRSRWRVGGARRCSARSPRCVVGVVVGVGAALLLRPLAAEDAEWLSSALGDDGARGRAARFVTRLGSRS